jgi:hypothetical protein
MFLPHFAALRVCFIFSAWGLLAAEKGPKGLLYIYAWGLLAAGKTTGV